jgi:outer membrane protein assembly factor BamB
MNLTGTFRSPSAAVIDGKVVLGGRDKLVLQRCNWQADLDIHHAVADRLVARHRWRRSYRSNDGRFYVLDQATGAKIWEDETGSPLSASPAIAGGRVVIGAQDGHVYCFGR